MSKPIDKTTFKNYCLRRLGAPVINIEVEEDQVDERVDDALQMYLDFHYDGTEKHYYKYKLTATDIANKYITLPPNIIGVSKIFPLGTTIAMSSIFSFQYQYILNNIHDISSTQLAPYFMTMQYLQFIEQLLVGMVPIRFNKNTDRLYLDMNWGRVSEDYWIMVETYRVLDPDEYTDIWNDRWLKEYATALIKRQWGQHLSKFSGQTLPGGTQFNGEKIYNDAVREIEKLEQDVQEKYGGVLEFYSG